MIFLSSFVRAIKYFEHGVPVFSVARWQPRSRAEARPWPELSFLAATDAYGRPLRLRNYPDAPIAGYCAAYGEALAARWAAVRQWLDGLSPDAHAVLACWCPHSSVGRRQVAEHGTFFCHTMLIGEVIRTAKPDVLVHPDRDRRERWWGARRCEPSARVEPWWGADLTARLVQFAARPRAVVESQP